MIPHETAEHFLKELNDIFDGNELTFRKKILSFRTIYRKLITKLTENEKQYFSSVFARAVYIADKYEFPEELTTKIRTFTSIAERIRKDLSFEISIQHLNYAYVTLIELINFLHPSGNEEYLIDKIKTLGTKIPLPKYARTSDTIEFIRAVVVEKGTVKTYSENSITDYELICESEEFGKIKLRFRNPWGKLHSLTWKGAVLNVFSVKRDAQRKDEFKAGNSTIIVLEPDNLVDVTDIAECFQYNGSNALIYFLSKFKLKSTNAKAITGNIINSCFDEILNNSESNFEDAYENALKIKPLQIFAIATNNPKETKEIKENAKTQYDNLRRITSGLDYDRYSIEPTFISSDYGLQGRLDVLIEFEDEINRKNIIELKSGKAPGKDMSAALPDGRFVKTGIWVNHYIQAICYNLLLDSAYDSRTGTSQILYSQTEDEPLRNAPNIIQKKQEAIAIRNEIVAYERQFAGGNFSLFDRFKENEFGLIPKFDVVSLDVFEKFYSNSNELYKAYFQNFISFIMRESQSLKHGVNGSDSSKGFSSLWKETIEDKENSYDVLSHLQLIKEESDFENFHLIFRRTEKTPDVTSFRKGDIGVLYRLRDGNVTEPLRQQILKCSIKEIGNEIIKVSLRNKQANSNVLNTDELWVIEPDYIDASTRNLFQSVYRLMLCNEAKREIILGIRKPDFAEQEKSENNYLNQPQKEILSKALSAKNYFLIQGPPGTGKTAYMLRALTEEFYKKDDSNIFLLAYTNRAVDEICTALDNIVNEKQTYKNNIPFDYLRLGSKESTGNNSKLISHLAETMEIRELFKLVKQKRVFVSTVTSAITNPEIFQIKKFNIAIIDEASQILEPQIVGILTQVDKFFMIGDEKQLPAVVVQHKNITKIEIEPLKTIYLSNLAGSLFERLIRCCIMNGWNNAFGMLTHQARMHEDIQEFVNSRFYDGMLQTMYPRQKEYWTKFDSNSDTLLEKQLSISRVLFFESKPEVNVKVHKAEAEKAAELVKTIYDKYGSDFDERTVGVIAPFRAQCAEIYRNIPKHIADLVTVDTVERFQGSQRDIIIISFAINNLYELKNLQSMLEIGDIKVDRKLNVALTRAKEQIILMGVADVLSYSPIFKGLIKYIRWKGGYYKLNS
ncbi:MAG: DNA2/NAM7 family helicase [Bacteroidetes bacterium]|nr:DNA2/NAM7 family helicase [Bacteroidota bacterium]